MTRFQLADGDARQRRMRREINVSVIDMRLEIALVLGAESAMRATEGRRFAALELQVTLQDVRVLVALAALGAIVPAIEMRLTAADAADIRMIVVTAGRVPRWTVQPGSTMRRQRCRHVARHPRRRRAVGASGDASRATVAAAAVPAETGEERTCKRREQPARLIFVWFCELLVRGIPVRGRAHLLL